MGTRSEKAQELFKSGANCAQAVFAVFHKECGLELDEAMKIASGFGGGMGRMREVCGTVSGMVLVANYLKGCTAADGKEAKDRHYQLIQSLAGEFRRQNGSIVCKELLGLVPQVKESPVSEERTPEYYRKRPCAELVAMAVDIAEKQLL